MTTRTQTQNTETLHILARMDQLTAIADLRRAQASDWHVSAIGGAGMNYLNSDELRELHELRMKLPTFAQERKEAQARIKARLEKRRGLNA